jgi:hypothetical protein
MTRYIPVIIRCGYSVRIRLQFVRFRIFPYRSISGLTVVTTLVVVVVVGTIVGTSDVTVTSYSDVVVTV